MAYDNIKLTKSSFTVVDGFFFYFNNTNNLLIKKNSSGGVIFTYPIIDYLASEVISTEYDGINFWTLQEGSVSGNFVVKMWRIENFLCLKKDEIEFNFVDDAHTHNLTALSVEHCCTTLVSGVSEGASELYIDKIISEEDYEAVVIIGPNSADEYDISTVSGVNSDGSLGLNLYTRLYFDEGTPVSLITDLWLFDSYSSIEGHGTLFRYNILEDYINYYFVDGGIDVIGASTFYSTGAVDYVSFISGTSLKFFNVTTKTIDKSLTIDNTNAAGSVIYPITDIAIFDGTLYRLQKNTSYYGADYSHSTYNYQCSPVRSFVDSITLGIYPKIIPSDGMSVSELSVVVKDQYSEPSQFKTVYVTDDDDEYGYITTPETMTWEDGTCLSYYMSGTSPKTVTITTMVTQFN